MNEWLSEAVCINFFINSCEIAEKFKSSLAKNYQSHDKKSLKGFLNLKKFIDE